MAYYGYREPISGYEHGRGRPYPVFRLPPSRLPGAPPPTQRIPGVGPAPPPPFAAPPVAGQDTAGGAAPQGFGDLLQQLLSGFAGAGGGTTPEEGLAAARRALIQYGGDISNLGNLKNLAGAFDSGTAKLASENTKSGLSILARINQAHLDQQRYIKNRLAAHGILDSGETGYQTGREQTNYAGAQQDAAGRLLDYLGGINSGISAYLQQQALLDAIRNAQQTPPGGVPGPENTGSYPAYAPPNYEGGYWPGGGTYDPHTGRFYEGWSLRPRAGQHYAE